MDCNCSPERATSGYLIGGEVYCMGKEKMFKWIIACSSPKSLSHKGRNECHIFWPDSLRFVDNRSVFMMCLSLANLDKGSKVSWKLVATPNNF